MVFCRSVTQNARTFSGRIRLLSRLACSLALVCFLGTVGSTVNATPVRSGMPATTPGYRPEPSIRSDDPVLAPYYHQKIDWRPCLKKGDRTIVCGYFAVPLDYSKPAGKELNLFAVKVLPTGPVRYHAIMNPGGPGESGVLTTISYAKIWRAGPYGKNLAFTSFDPRGAGLSIPQSVCLSDREQDSLRQTPALKNDPAGIVQAEHLAKDFAHHCQTRLGASFLRHVGTADSAKDLDVFRAILGDKKLTYIGFSYGTFLGTSYMEQFPYHTRAIVLDGVVNAQSGRLEAAVRENQARQQVVLDFSHDCMRHPGCAIKPGSTDADIIRFYQKLLRHYNFQPAKTTSGRKVYAEDVYTGIGEATYQRSFWPLLRKALTELQHGNGNSVLELADMYDARSPNGHYDPLQDNFRMVNCVDNLPLSQAELNQIDAQVRRVAPIFDDGLGSGVAPLDECSYWPVPPALKPHPIVIHQDVKPVVVSTTHDPATPYEEGVNLAHTLGAPLITVQDSQHTALLLNKCADAIVAPYLLNGILPPPHSVCGPGQLPQNP